MGVVFGRYQVIRELGRGAMGTVYEAHDPQLKRTVALKVLTAVDRMQGVERVQAVERFHRESRAAGSLVHPNIAQIFDVGEDKGRNYIVMELCRGTLLRDVISFEGPMQERRLKNAVAQLLSALEVAHKQGIVHRDLKPDNIMLGPSDELKLMDFGIAKIAGDGTMTSAGQVIGSPAYMSPEQVMGAPVDARSDIFSVGAVIYECLTGRKPFDGPSITAVTHKIAMEEPAPMQAASPFWHSFVMKALAKNPQYRFQSVTEMLAALNAGMIPGQQHAYAVSAQGAGAPGVAQTQYVPAASNMPPLQQRMPPGAPQTGQQPQGPYQAAQYPPSRYPPGQHPQPPYPGGAYQPPYSGYLRPHRGETVWWLGLLGVLCCYPLAVTAWIMGAADIKAMDAGQMDRSGYDKTQRGMTCGIVGTVIWAVFVALGILGQ